MRVLPLAGAAACAGLAFHPVFAWLDLLPVVLPAAVVPTGLAWLLRHRPLWISLLANVGAWVAAVYVLFSSPTVSAVTDGLRNGWRTILATLPPLPGKPELLILVLTCTWLAALIGAETVARTRQPMLGTLPPITAAGLACVLSGGSNVYAIAGLALMCALLTVRRPVGAALVAGCTAVAMLVLPLASWPERLDPRDDVAKPEPRLARAVSPLDQIAPWLRSPDRELFTVQSGEPSNWRLAVFDTFNGATWTSSALFQPTGGAIPSVHDGHPRTAQITTAHITTARITVAALPGPWLPAADRPSSVTGVPIQVDPASGMLIAAESLQPGMHYDVSSTLADPDPATLRTAPAGSGAVELPGIDGLDQLRATAQKATIGAAYPYQQAALLEKHLLDNYFYDPSATPGHNLRSLQLFLSTTRRGTSEQFATAFAVMARTLGLPSRVVVGFRPGLQQDGAWRVRTGDVLAWPEVNFAGAGWVPFHPTPNRIGESTPDSAGDSARRQELNRQVVKEAQRQSLTPPPADPAPAVAAAPPAPPAPSPWDWRYLLALPFLYAILVLAIPAVRLQTKRRLTAPDQIAFAWRRAHRRLTPLLTEFPDLPALTNTELAHAGVAVLGEESRVPLTTLARLADQSEFSTELLTPRLATLAWQRLRTLESLIWRRTNPLRRLHPRRFND